MKLLKVITYVVLVFGMGFTLWVMFKNVSSEGPYWATLLFMAWAVWPYVGLGLFTGLQETHILAGIGHLVLALVLTSAGAYALVDAFFLHLDPQSAIVLVTLPGVQGIPVLLSLLVFAGTLHRKVQKSQD